MFFAIEEFVALGRAQSFSGAARRLGVSTSHVSRRINALEEKLGVRLVARTTRKVKLTDAGYEYFLRCVELSEGMEEANQSVAFQSAELEGRLRISAAGDFSERFVAPALAKFSKQHPKLIIDLDFNSRNLNLIDEGIDFAIRYGNLSDSTLVARKLVERRLALAASEQFIEENGMPKTPQECAQFPCIIANSDQWRFIEHGKTLTVKAKEAWRSNSARAVVAACEAGVGLAYLPETSYGDKLDSGALKPLLKDFWFEGTPTWLVFPSRRFMPLRARRAVEFLLEHFAVWRR
jgi:DNA-binding transcriptional LysR family regulator